MKVFSAWWALLGLAAGAADIGVQVVVADTDRTAEVVGLELTVADGAPDRGKQTAR